MKKHFIVVPVVFAIALSAFLIITLHNKYQYDLYPHERQRVLMGTLFKIKAFEDKLSKEEFIAATDSAFAEVSKLEGEMSEWIPDTPVSMISKYAGIKPVRATDDVIYVIDLALSVSKQTEGVFDITFKPLGYLWNVKDIKKPPEYAEIQKALGLIDYRDVVVDKDNKTIFLKRLGMSIGLDGIAKGYAAGKAAKKMEEHGIHNFIINAGGDLYYSGKKNRKYWTCGIRNPDSKDDSIVKKFEIRSNCAVATSGDYEKFFVFEGVRYHHIIDPRTGYPGVGVRSVTVFSEDPALADAYATSFFLLGYEKSLKITNEKQDVAFVMIDKDGKILKSNNISRFAEDITGH